MAQRTTNSPVKPTSIASQIDGVVELLRVEWKEQFQKSAAEQAERKLRAISNSTTDNAVGFQLARAEQMLRGYLMADIEESRRMLPEIGTLLKETRELAAATPQRIEPPSPVPARPRGAVRHVAPTASVEFLPKVGSAVAKKLQQLGVATVGDLLNLKPRKHIDYSKTIEIGSVFSHSSDEEVTICGQITEVTSYPGPPARVQVKFKDATGVARATWFNPYLAKQLVEHDEIAISGRPDRGYGMLSFTSPEWERLGEEMLTAGRLTPVYPLTKGLTEKQMRSLVRSAIDSTHTTLTDPLPEEILEAHRLWPLQKAVEQSHFPDDPESLARANRRLAFDELFYLQLGMLRLRQDRQQHGATPLLPTPELLAEFTAVLPYQLTDAQTKAIAEIAEDLAKDKPMSRLLQGDVGSGKTVVAAVAARIAQVNGFQSAVMAPTEILAEQHYSTFNAIFDPFPEETRPQIALITGSTPVKQKRLLSDAISSGRIDIVIGTHALIQGSLEFAKLGLVVVDEQHRFGVRQRSELLQQEPEQGQLPHMLAMTATPIPRTLSMVLHGDLEISVLGELPPGRVPIITRRYTEADREMAYDLIRTEVGKGRQVFVICPLIEESDLIVAKAAVAEGERLQKEVFPELRVATLHGRMSGKEKDRIMTEFRDKAHDILVSTSVIEVGVDVPNATVMAIEGADRFGLAQLHQLRGRVGRSEHQSFCLLLSDMPGGTADTRLQTMVETNDGFVLADKDLELRGPGDFVGTRQSGLPEMPWLKRGLDSRNLSDAREAATRVLASDPELDRPVHAALARQLKLFWAKAAPDLPLA